MRNLNSLTVRFAVICVVLTLAECSATAQSWQVQYDGSVLPTAASPPWDYVGNASFGSVNGGILRLNWLPNGQEGLRRRKGTYFRKIKKAFGV